MEYVNKQPIHAGLSGDKKYSAQSKDGRKVLLRYTDITQYDKKKAEFERMQTAFAQGVPMCEPIGLFCEDGQVCQALGWCEGANLEEMLPVFTKEQQYEAGCKAGKILRAIHRVPAPEGLADWYERYWGQNALRVEGFRKSGVQIEGSDRVLRFVEENREILRGRPQCLHHGDFHAGNIICAPDGRLSVIDWETIDYENWGDPWEEFNRLGNTALHAPYAAGMVRGYFDGEPPEEFWRVLALYLCAGALMLVSWAYHLQKDELPGTVRNMRDLIENYDGMKTVVPKWYR